MSDDPLYHKTLLRLAADANGAGRLAAPNATGSAHNPICGDRVSVDLAIVDDRIVALVHNVQACVIAQASAAILSDTAKGLDSAGVRALGEAVRAMLKDGGPVPHPAYAVFDGVAEHANRHKCVLLPIEAALGALEGTKPGT